MIAKCFFHREVECINKFIVLLLDKGNAGADNLRINKSIFSI